MRVLDFSKYRLGIVSLVIASVGTLLTGNVFADLVQLKTGEKLIGKVVSEDKDGQLVFDHPVLGELTIPLAQVSVISEDPDPDAPSPEILEIEPNEGDQTPSLPPEQMARIREEVKEEVKQEIAAEEAAKAKGEPKLDPYEGLPPEAHAFLLTLREWNVSLSLGVSGSSGGEDTLSFRVDGSASHKDEHGRLALSTYYYHLQSGGETSEDKANFTAQYDWNFLGEDSRWLLWAKGSYDYDITTSWRNRVSAFGGIGYRIFDKEDLQLVGRFGPGATYNFSGDENFQPELYFGLDLIKWQVVKGQTLTGNVAFIPDVSQPQYNRTQVNAEYKIKIPDVPGISLKAGVNYEYDSITDDDSSHNQLNYYGAVVYDF